jgi:tetratricopeptide (TPR) repeat protein
LLDTAAQLRDRGDLAARAAAVPAGGAIGAGNPEIHFTAATVLEAGRDYRNAIDAYRQVLKLKPGFLPAMVNCAACLADLGEVPDSIELYRAALKADPRSAGGAPQSCPGAHAPAAARRGGAAPAGPGGRTAGPCRPFRRLAEALDRAGDRDGALAAYEEALKRGAPVAPTRVLMARVELVRGNLERRAPISRRPRRPIPHDGHVHFVLANNFAEPESLEARIAAAEAALAAADGKPVEAAAAPLRFALGRLNDRAGRFDEAFRQFEAGNALFADRHLDEDQRLSDRAAAVKAQFSDEFFSQRREGGSASEQPVFVFGLPRSGTTLLEQILASHKPTWRALASAT